MRKHLLLAVLISLINPLSGVASLQSGVYICTITAAMTRRESPVFNPGRMSLKSEFFCDIESNIR